jgi:DNA-binding transcriptional LysR family regulator
MYGVKHFHYLIRRGTTIVNFHQLHIFYVVAMKGSFSSAAQILHMTQPAVTMQIQTLEERFGTKLFHRSTKKVVLSEAGRALFPVAKQAFQLMREADAVLSPFTHSTKGVLQLGAAEKIHDYILPRLLRPFREEFNHVAVNLQKRPNAEIVPALLSHQISLGLTEDEPIHPDIEAEPLLDDEYVLVMPKDHPLASRNLLTLAEALEYPFIFEKWDGRARRLFEQAVVESGRSPESIQIAHEVNHTEQVKAAVEANLGLSIFSRWAIRNEEKSQILKARPIEDANMVQNVYAVFIKHSLIPMSAVTFVSFAKGKNVDVTETQMDQR